MQKHLGKEFGGEFSDDLRHAKPCTVLDLGVPGARFLAKRCELPGGQN